MAQTSVAQFATDLKMPAAVLLEQLQKAGVVKNKADDLLSEQDKSKLLEYLRRSHGEADSKTKITLMRKETSEIRAQDSHGKSRTVQVEVRKKRVLVKRDPAELRAEALGAKPPVAPTVTEVVPEVHPEPVVEREVVPVVTPEAPPVAAKELPPEEPVAMKPNEPEPEAKPEEPRAVSIKAGQQGSGETEAPEDAPPTAA